MESNQLTDAAIGALQRRAMFKRASLGLASAAVLATLGNTVTATPAAAATYVVPSSSAPTALDIAILNFALNLEYVEAQFYLNALLGSGLTPAQLAGGNGQAGGTPVPAGNTLVPFQTPIVRQLAQTIAADEQAHVLFLKTALGTAAVPAPVIDVTATGAFSTLARAAGLISASQVFNPYQDENAFLLGAYIFEDVGVTAYAGASALLSQGSALVQYAASILAMEAYHSGTIRTLLITRGGGLATNAVSNLRSMLSSGAAQGTAQGDDFGTLDPVSGNVVLAPRDANALSYRRSVAQVLNIVYGNTNKTPGLFLPNGTSVTPGTTGFS